MKQVLLQCPAIRLLQLDVDMLQGLPRAFGLQWLYIFGAAKPTIIYLGLQTVCVGSTVPCFFQVPNHIWDLLQSWELEILQ